MPNQSNPTATRQVTKSSLVTPLERGVESSSSSSECRNPISRQRSNLNCSEIAPSKPYELTVRRGFLALIIMYVCQTLVGLAFAYGVRSLQSGNNSAGAIDIQIIGMISVLIGGAVVFLWAWADIRRLRPSVWHQIRLQPCAIKTN